MAINNPKEFATAADIAGLLSKTVVKLHTSAGEDGDAAAGLKPIEEMLCFYEVDPGSVTLAELRAGAREMSGLLSERLQTRRRQAALDFGACE